MAHDENKNNVYNVVQEKRLGLAKKKPKRRMKQSGMQDEMRRAQRSFIHDYPARVLARDALPQRPDSPLDDILITARYQRPVHTLQVGAVAHMMTYSHRLAHHAQTTQHNKHAHTQWGVVLCCA